MPSAFARVPRLALVVYVLLVLVVVFQPQPELAVGSVVRLDEWLVRAGAPEAWVAGHRVEFLLNIALFVPIAFLGSLSYPRVRWSEWVVVAFVASVGIEMVQGVFIPARSAQFADIVSNTAGGLAGAILAAPLRRSVARLAGKRPAGEYPVVATDSVTTRLSD